MNPAAPSPLDHPRAVRAPPPIWRRLTGAVLPWIVRPAPGRQLLRVAQWDLPLPAGQRRFKLFKDGKTCSVHIVRGHALANVGETK